MKALLDAGVDVVRLNAAHAAPKVHAEHAATARAAAASLDRTVGVLVDLPGPKLRTGPVVNDEVMLRIDSEVVLTADPIEGDEHRVSTTVPELARWVRVGDEVFLADGAIVLCVEQIDGDDVVCRVVRAGLLRSRKGMHVPRAEGHVEAFTEADAAALEMAVRIKADFVGLSFVRHPEDVEAVRARLPKRGPRPHLVAKIETAVALDHLAGIVAMSDAVMVARGDLGIQVPARRVPLIQKEIIRFCNMAGKPVITATQMLESMTRSPLPTRAEVNDVANAVIDGTDALDALRRRPRSVSTPPTPCARWQRSPWRRSAGRAHASIRPARPPPTTTTGSHGPSRTHRSRPRKISVSRRSCARPRAVRPPVASPRSARPSRSWAARISPRPSAASASCGVCGRCASRHRRRASRRSKTCCARPATRASCEQVISSRSCRRHKANAPAAPTPSASSRPQAVQVLFEG